MILAIPAAAPAIPPNPKNAASIATIKKVNAKRAIIKFLMKEMSMTS